MPLDDSGDQVQRDQTESSTGMASVVTASLTRHTSAQVLHKLAQERRRSFLTRLQRNLSVHPMCDIALEMTNLKLEVIAMADPVPWSACFRFEKRPNDPA